MVKIKAKRKVLDGHRILDNYRDVTHPTFSSGKHLLQNYYNISKKAAEQIVQRSYTYGINAKKNKPKYRNPVFCYRKRELLQSDLIDMQDLSKYNSGYKYILLTIDTASRKLFYRIIKRKDAQTVLNQMDDIFQNLDRKPLRIFFDRGKEFVSKIMTAYLNRNNIKITKTTSEIKAPHVERAGYSLQRIIYNYLTEFQTKTYIDVLPDLVHSLNTRPHSALNGYSPEQADEDSFKNTLASILFNNYTKIITKGRTMNTTKFKIGDKVRLKRAFNKFNRGYKAQFMGEVFTVIEIDNRKPIQTYTVEDQNGEEIVGSFYPGEMNLIAEKFSDYRVDLTGESKIVNNKRMVEVRWIGYDDRYNTWIEKEDYDTLFGFKD